MFDKTAPLTIKYEKIINILDYGKWGFMKE